MNIGLYTLTSALHDEQAVSAVRNEFLNNINVTFDFKGDDYDDFGCQPLSIIYVCTGGTEGIFRQLLPQLRNRYHKPFYLLASGKSNSLAASLEILSYLRQQNLKGEIIHGSAEYITRRLNLLQQTAAARQQLEGCRLGVIGAPSDWLISSHADYNAIEHRLGIKLIDIPISELLEAIGDSQPDTDRIYEALKALIDHYQLQGFTLRCFDLLTAIRNTGCLPLARLNAEGYVAGCEGDVPAMLSMMIARSLTDYSGFQANPATIDPETGEILFAHCTIPLNMVERYELDTHFESGIGTAIRGYMQEGPVTIFKVSGDLTRHFIAEGELIRNQAKPDLCRTQQVIRLNDRQQTAYFLTEPIGNHHIILKGHHQALLEELLKTTNC